MINLKSRFNTLRNDLYAAYNHVFSVEEINNKLEELIEKHFANAKVDDFVAILVEREMKEHFGSARKHVRFSAGSNTMLARVAAELTKKYAGDALEVDTAVEHPENVEDSHLAFVLNERGMSKVARRRDAENRTLATPDYIVYLGADVPRDESGKDVKVWAIPEAETIEETRELADDLEARVLYMLDKLGVEAQYDTLTQAA